MTRRRVGLGLLTIAMVAVVVFLALREAGDFERISGVTSRDEATAEPTLRGLDAEATPGEGHAKADASGPSNASAPEADAWTATVHVVDLDQQRVAGAKVHLGDGKGQRTLATDDDGVVTMRTRQPWIEVRLEDRWSSSARLTRPRREVTLVQLHLLPLVVRIVDDADGPVRGATVHAQLCWSRPNATFDGGSTTCERQVLGVTDDQGWCTTDLPVTVDSLRITVDHAHEHATASVEFPFEHEVMLRLGRRGRIECVIVDPEGKRLRPEGVLVARPVAGSRPTVRLPDSPWFVEEELEFVEPGEEAGREPPPPLTLHVPDDGPWRVHFEPHRTNWTDSEPVLVTAPASDVRLALRRTVSIRGRVLGTDARSFFVRWIPDAAATDDRGNALVGNTDADGSFEIAGVAPGPGRLFAFSLADDRYALLTDVEAPLEGVQLHVVDGLAIVGRIEGYTAAEDLPGSRLSVVARDGPFFAVRIVEERDAHDDGTVPGTFRIGGLPPGRYDLWWSRWMPWGGANGPWRSFGISVDLGPETKPVVLPCPR